MTEQFARKMEEGVKPLGIRLSESSWSSFTIISSFWWKK